MILVTDDSKFKISDCDVKNLFISLGSLVVKNYSEIILQHNNELTSRIKSELTLLINNLLLCNQLQSKIFDLKDAINKAEANLKDFKIELDKIREQKICFEESLYIKKNKLIQLNQENINLLLRIGEWFYQKRLLVEKDEFNQLYDELSHLLNDEEAWDELLVEELDNEKAILYNLLQPYPNFLI